MDKLKLFKRVLICVLFTAILSGCGFQLRGAYQLPVAMQTTFVDAQQKNSELVRMLKRRLRASDITLVDQASPDAAVFKLGKEKKSKRIVSVDSSGRAREYTLSYAIHFSVSAAAADFEIAEQNISIDRDFLFDTEDVLGKSREESQLYNEMQQDIVRLILLRLQSKQQK